MNITTKFGDNGMTRNFDGDVLPKYDEIIMLGGEIDELNAHVAMCHSMLSKVEFEGKTDILNGLLFVQKTLMKMGKEVSTNFTDKTVTDIDRSVLDVWITRLAYTLHPLDGFVMYNGSVEYSQIHVTRAVCRRVERMYSMVYPKKDFPESFVFLNRLSDYLFLLARYIFNNQQ